MKITNKNLYEQMYFDYNFNKYNENRKPDILPELQYQLQFPSNEVNIN